MQIFENADGQSFKLNSVKYVKNFIVMPVGSDSVAVLNAYDSKLQLLPSTHFSQVMVNNATFQNQESLMATLAPMLFTKIIYSDSILPNQLISIPEIVRAQNLLTIAPSIWRIDGIVVGNSEPFQTVIAYEDAGMNRIDIIVAKSSGIFEKIVGDSSETTASAPLVPSNSLFVTSVNIFGNEIIQGEDPIVGAEYIKKSHDGFFHVLALDNAQNGPVTLQFSPDGANKFKIWNATAIRGFAYATNSEAQVNGWGGKSYYLTNETPQPITLKNNVSGIIGFVFPSGQDMILPPKATVEFVYDSKMRYVGVEHIAPIIQTLESVTENGYTTSKPLISYAGENGGIRAQSTDGLKSASIGADGTSGIVSVAKNQNAKGVIKANNLTTQRNLELPNASGTFALTSDVTNSISNIDFQVNQSSAILSLTNSSGQEITSIDLSFLNNEGTTFFYNSTTEKLELKNDAGEVLSELPISSFVSNFAKSLSLNASTLSLRDNAGNILNSVEITTTNVDGLDEELDSKVDKITGYSLTQNDLTNALKIAYDNAVLASSANATAINNHVGNTANPHGVTKVQVGLGNADNTSDLNKPISNAQAVVNATKANDADVVHKSGDESISGVKQFNSTLIANVAPSADNHVARLQEVNKRFLRHDAQGTQVDCNLLTLDGIYTGFNWLNAPVNTIGTLTSVVYSPDWISQTFSIITNALRTWTRTRYNGDTFSPWRENWTQGNLNPDIKADYDGANTVGGTWRINTIYSPAFNSLGNNQIIDTTSDGGIYWGNPLVSTHTFEMATPSSMRTYVPGSGFAQIWHGHNFNPDNKANANEVILKGGGVGMSNNIIRLGWSGNAILAQVDNTPLGGLVLENGGNYNISVFNANGVGGYAFQDANNIDFDQILIKNAEGNISQSTKAQAIEALGINSKANDADVVKINGNQNIFGSKTFAFQIRANSGVYIPSDSNSAVTMAKADGTPVLYVGTAQSGLSEDGNDSITYSYFGKHRIYTSALERFVFDNENISRMPLKVEGQVKSNSDFFVQNSSGFSRLTAGDITLRFDNGSELYASPNGIAKTYDSTFDLYNLNFPETSTNAIVSLPNRAGTIALLEDVSDNYQPLVENTDWINLAHSLPSSYNNVIFRYKIKNGMYVLDFYSECLATSVVGNADSFQIGIVENADGEFLRSYNLGDWMVDIGSSITNLKLKSLGGDNDPITLVGNLRDTSIDKISFRATLPITRN